MKKIKYSHLILISFVSLIIIYILISDYVNKYFSFRLAETYLFLSISKFIEISQNFNQNEIHSYLFMAISIDIIWPITYSLFFIIVNYKLIKSKKVRKFVNIYIIFIFIVDMVENILTGKFLITNKIIYANLSVLATNIKWISIFFIIIISLINLIKYIKHHGIKALIEE